MRIVLDHNLPRQLRRAFGEGHDVSTARQLGLAGAKNGALLASLGGVYDALVTGDKNLRYHQNLTNRTLAIVELPTNRWPVLRQMQETIAAAVLAARPTSYTIVDDPRQPHL